MVETKKFKDWCKYFLDPSSPSYGNKTQSAMRAYKCKLYTTAGQIGWENYKKLENQMALIADSQGYGAVDLFKITMKKAMEGSFSDWERFMERLGYFQPLRGVPNSVINQQFKLEGIAEAFIQARKERGLPIGDEPFH